MIREMLNFTFCSQCCNASQIELPLTNRTYYEEHRVLFWFFASVCILVALLTVIGNGIVIYVSIKTKSYGRLRYLDNVVQSLAITDFLFGVIVTPLVVTSYYMGT